MNLKKFKKSLVSIVLGSSLFLGNGGVICQQPKAWLTEKFFKTAIEGYGNKASIMMLLLGFLQRFSDYSRRSGGQVEQLVAQFYDSYKSKKFILDELRKSTTATQEGLRRQLMLTTISLLIHMSGATRDCSEEASKILTSGLRLDELKNYEDPASEILQAMMDIIHESAKSTDVELELLKLIQEVSDSVCSNQLQRQPDMFSTNAQQQYSHDNTELLENFVKFFSDKRFEPYYEIATSMLSKILDTFAEQYIAKFNDSIMNLGPSIMNLGPNALSETIRIQAMNLHIQAMNLHIRAMNLNELFCLLKDCCQAGTSMTPDTCQRLFRLKEADQLPELLHTALTITENLLNYMREKDPENFPQFIYDPCMKLLNELKNYA